MKIDSLKDLDIGMSNIEISGEVTYANDPRNFKGDSKGRHYDFWSQYIAVEDETDSIGCNITIKNEEAALFEGDQVTIKGKLTEFEDKDGNMQRKLNGRIKRTREEKAREEENRGEKIEATEVTGEKKETTGGGKKTNNGGKKTNNGGKKTNNGGKNELHIVRECAIKAVTELAKISPDKTFTIKVQTEKDFFAFSDKIVKYIYKELEETAVKAKAEEEPSSARHKTRREPLEIRDKNAPEVDEVLPKEEDIPF
ncbi:hypothetical protein ES708_17540 [subsurface metagenome]